MTIEELIAVLNSQGRGGEGARSKEEVMQFAKAGVHRERDPLKEAGWLTEATDQGVDIEDLALLFRMKRTEVEEYVAAFRIYHQAQEQFNLDGVFFQHFLRLAGSSVFQSGDTETKRKIGKWWSEAAATGKLCGTKYRAKDVDTIYQTPEIKAAFDLNGMDGLVMQ